MAPVSLRHAFAAAHVYQVEDGHNTVVGDAATRAFRSLQARLTRAREDIEALERALVETAPQGGHVADIDFSGVRLDHVSSQGL